jgi:hypothetical protein
MHFFKSPWRVFLLFLLIFFGYKAINELFAPWEAGLLAINYGYFCLVILVMMPVFIMDYSAFKNDRRLSQFISGMIGFLIIAVVIIKMIWDNKIDNSKTVLRVINKPQAVNVWMFEFKENEHFKLTDMNLFGSTTYSGRYEMLNDNITILESNYNGGAKKFPIHGIVRNDTLFWAGADTMLVGKWHEN